MTGKEWEKMVARQLMQFPKMVRDASRRKDLREMLDICPVVAKERKLREDERGDQS